MIFYDLIEDPRIIKALGISDRSPVEVVRDVVVQAHPEVKGFLAKKGELHAEYKIAEALVATLA